MRDYNPETDQAKAAHADNESYKGFLQSPLYQNFLNSAGGAGDFQMMNNHRCEKCGAAMVRDQDFDAITGEPVSGPYYRCECGHTEAHPTP